MLKRIILRVLFPFGNHFSKGKSHIRWSRKNAPFRPEGFFDWAFVASQYLLIICWLDSYIARAPWELGINGIIILAMYVGLLFFSYPIRILYMVPESLPHRLFWTDRNKGTEYPYPERSERFNEGNLPNFMAILAFWPAWIYHFINNAGIDPFLITALDKNSSGDTLSRAYYLAYEFSSDFSIIAVYNVTVIVLIFLSYLVKSRGF